MLWSRLLRRNGLWPGCPLRRRGTRLRGLPFPMQPRNRETAETHPGGGQDAPTALLSGRHYVVLGGFQHRRERPARRAGDRARESALRCRIYRFGGKFMVSPFSSDDAGACAQFIRVQDGRFPDAMDLHRPLMALAELIIRAIDWFFTSGPSPRSCPGRCSVTRSAAV